MSESVSVAIIVKNGMPLLERCLASITFTKDVTIVLDQASDDGTREFLEKTEFEIIEHEWLGFGKQHQLVTKLCKHDWVIKLDSDEFLTQELNAFLNSFSPDNDKTIYTFRRKNFVANQWIKGAGWWPDRVRRLFNRKESSFTDDEVHETVRGENEVLQERDECIEHFAYEKIDDFIDKVKRYSSLRATDMYNRGKKTSVSKAFFHGFFAFIQSYILRSGYRDRYWGMVIACSTATVAFLKYMKLLEMQKNKKT